MSASPPTPDQGNKRLKKRWFAYFGANSLAISILLHVLFGLGATYLVVEHFQKKHINFHATEPPSQHTEIEHKVELAKRNNVESAPPDIKRIVTTDVSAITLPEPPELPNDEASPSAMDGVDGVMGMGLGSGAGKGGGGGGGGIPLFGDQSGNGFEGTIYDLKIGPDHQSTGMTTDTYTKVVADLVENGWNESSFAPYYKASKKLYTPAMWIPTVPSPSTATAMDLENELTPILWVGWYTAKVMAPRDGRFHFVGFGDDILAVAINGNMVFDGGSHRIIPAPPRMPWPYADWSRIVTAGGLPYRGGGYGQLRVGDTFEANTIETMKVDVLMGDMPGGFYSAFLLIVDESRVYPTGKGGVPLYPIFQLGPGAINRPGDQPPHSTDQDPWIDASK